MAAISLNIGTPYVSSGTSTTHAIPLPSSMTSSNSLYVFILMDSSASVTGLTEGLTLDSGLSDGGTVSAGNLKFWRYKKTVSGSESSTTTATFSAAVQLIAVAVEVDPVTGVSGTFTTNSSSTNLLVSSYTTTGDNSTLFYFVSCAALNSLTTNSGYPSGSTGIMARNSGTPVAMAGAAAYEVIPTSGTVVSGKQFTAAASTDYMTYVMEFLEVVAAAPLALTDINTDEDVTDGEQDCTFTTTDGTPEITDIDLISGAYTLSATGVSSASGSGTFDLPDVTSYTSDTAGIPFGAVTFRATDSNSDTADLVGTYSVASGWASVTVSSASILEDSIFYYRVGGAPADGSQIYYNTANNTTVSADGTWTSDVSIIQPKVWVAGTWEPITAAVLEECVISMTADGDDTPFLGVYQNSTLGQYVLVHQEDTGEPFFGSTSIPVATHSVAIRVNTDNPELLIDDVSEVTSTLSFASTTGIALSGIGALTKTSVTDYTGITIDDVTLTDPNNSSNNRLYECDEGSGTTLNDSLGSLETATLINGATWSLEP